MGITTAIIVTFSISKTQPNQYHLIPNSPSTLYTLHSVKSFMNNQNKFITHPPNSTNNSYNYLIMILTLPKHQNHYKTHITKRGRGCYTFSKLSCCHIPYVTLDPCLIQPLEATNSISKNKTKYKLLFIVTL